LLWLLLGQLWLLDFLRPVVNHYVHVPRGWPALGDVMHVLSAVLTPMILLALLAHATRNRLHLRTGWPAILTLVLVCLLCVGQGAHLAADSIEGRLAMRGLEAGAPPMELPEVQALGEPYVEVFALTFLYDEWISHWLWYVPLFGLIFLHAVLCRRSLDEGPNDETAGSRVPALSAYLGVPLLSLFWWYAAIEGRVWPLLLALALALAILRVLPATRAGGPAANSDFLTRTIYGGVLLLFLWLALFGHFPGFWEVVLGKTPLPSAA